MKGMHLVTREGLDVAYKTEMISNAEVWKPGSVGMIAWYLQRITGVALVGYLLLHIFLIGSSLLRGRAAFDSMLSLLMGSKLFLILDLALLAAVLIHGLNGIRLILFDVGVGILNQKKIFWTAMAIALGLFAWAVVRMGPELLK
jgi:succinate dehydrogenase / fumarate reductase cytochrome b subunit